MSLKLLGPSFASPSAPFWDYLAYATICCAVIYLLVLGLSAIIRPARIAWFLGAFAQTLPAHVLELALRVAVGAALIVRSPAMYFAQVFAVFGWILVGTSVLIALMPWRLHQRFARWSVPLATRRMRLLGVGAAGAGVVVLYALIVPEADSEATEAPTVIRVISFAHAGVDEDAFKSRMSPRRSETGS